MLKVRKHHPDATIILASHSQGTIISLDVLRLIGSELGKRFIWVTMGSPLGWYLNFANWGGDQLAIPSGTTWLNLYGRQDIVGTTLCGLVPLSKPKPLDIDLDNRAKVVDAHDHWHNPVVVEQYFQLIKGLLS